MLTFKTNILNGAPFYRGCVIYNKTPSDSRMGAYNGYVNSALRRGNIDNSKGACVYFSPTESNIKPFDLLEVAKAMRSVIATINNCENDRIRSGRRRIVLGDANAPLAL